MNSTSSRTITIPTNSTVPFATNTVIAVARLNTGSVTIQGVSSTVVVNGSSGGSVTISARYLSVVLTKIDTNTWFVSGSITV
jgi:hypothetical protein